MSTATLHIEKEISVPNLRFQEFEKDWEAIKFGKLYKFYTTNSLSRENLNYEVGDVYNVHYGDIHTKFQTHFYLRNERVPLILSGVDLLKIKEESYCKNGDLIIADASEDYADIGKSIELIEIESAKLLAGLHTFLARPISNKTFIGFTSYLLKSWRLRKQIMIIAQGTKVLSLSPGRFADLDLNLPTVAEQQKIASFLSAVDEKIQQLSRKKELLEEYKKGVMQQLFSGKLRFKDENGEDYPDWEEKKLGDLLQQKIRAVDKPKDNYLSIGIRSHAKGTFQKPDSDPNKISMEKLFIVKEGDLIVNITFAWEGAIAIVKKADDGGLVSHRFPTYTFLENKLLKEFFAQVIIDKRFRLILDLISPGGAGRNRVLSKSEFLKIIWSFPSVREQKKIADFLSSVDTKIEITTQQINQMQNFKKGLLQQMFV